jgi:ribosomal-protein-alanine N-acetyltransferase
MHESNAASLDIRTARLRLVPMTPDFLRALIAGQLDQAALIAGFAVPSGTLIPKWVLEHRLRTVEQDPTLQPWLLRSIVLAETETMIGDIGFHDRPGADYLREYCEFGVELGYSISPEHRRLGYANEALHGMLGWALDQHRVRSFILSISPANDASLRLAASMGFQKVGSHEDDVDGPEDIYLLDL